MSRDHYLVVTSPRARKTQPPTLLRNLATDCVYRAVAWQRVNQIRYNTFLDYAPLGYDIAYSYRGIMLV
jgi:hypothetical protein